MDNDGFSAAVDGRFSVLGSASDFVGSIEIGSFGYNLDIDHVEISLLGGLLSLEGAARFYQRSTYFDASFLDMTAMLDLPGFDQSFSVSGWVNSTGQFSLDGATDLDLGTSTLGIEGEITLHISHEGISGTLAGRLYVPGDYGSFTGSFEAGTWGFNIAAQSRFVLAGVVLIDGGIGVKMRHGSLTFYFDNVLATVSGFLEVRLNGHISSNGDIDLDGRTYFSMGDHSLASFSGLADVRIRDTDSIDVGLTGTVRIFGSELAQIDVWAEVYDENFSAYIDADGSFFDIIRYEGRVRFSLADGGVHLSWDVSAWAWGTNGGYTWGWVDTRGDTFDYDVNVRLWYEFGVGSARAEFRAEISLRTDGFYMETSGEVSLKVAWWRVSKGFSADFWVSSRGYISGRVGPVKFRIDLKYGGGSIWLSEVGGSTVFLDVNHNGELDDGEPTTTSDADGNFDFSETVVVEEVAPTLFATLDLNEDGILSTDEVSIQRIGGTRIEGEPEDSATLPAISGVTSFSGATVFLDLNANGQVDADEPVTTTDELGAYNLTTQLLGENADRTDPSGESPVSSRERLLGDLAVFDLDENGVIDAEEGRLYVVGGRENDPDQLVIRIWEDTDGDLVPDASEQFVDTTRGAGEDVFEVFTQIQSGTATDLGWFASFDDDKDGKLSDAEMERVRITTLPGDEITQPTVIEGVSSGTPATGYDYVFYDVNGNGAFDAGEPRAFPNADDRYDFAAAAGDPANVVDPLGRLRPFDTNGNDVIDFEEGIFVVLGGTDNDNGLENPLVVTGSAAGYGQGFSESISPISTLQIRLIEQGLSPEEATDRLAESLGLGAGVSLTNSNPNLGADDSSNALLAAGAKINAVISGGASLLGESTDEGNQDAVFDALASQLASGVVDFESSASVGAVIADAASRKGATVSSEAVAIAASGLAATNELIDEVAAEGGDISGELAAVKATVYTHVAATLEGVANGSVDATEAAAQLSSEMIKAKSEDVEVVVSAPPVAGAVSDRTVKGGDVLTVFVPVTDPDTDLSRLTLAATSSNGALIDGASATFVVDSEGWLVTLPTAAADSGDTTVTIAVSDGDTTSNTSFDVTFDGLNTGVKLIGGIESQELRSGAQVTIDLAQVFSDPDGNAVYTVELSSGGEVVTHQVANGVLTLTSRTDQAGFAVLKLTATDDVGAVSTSFAVVTNPDLEAVNDVRFESENLVSMDVTLLSPSNRPLEVTYSIWTQDGLRLDSGTLLFSANQLIQDLSFDLSDTPLAVPGVHDVTIELVAPWGTKIEFVQIDNSLPPLFSPVIADLDAVAVTGEKAILYPLPISDGDSAVAELVVTAFASDSTLIDVSTLQINLVDGGWQLGFTTADVSEGTALITIEVSDGNNTATSSFEVTITGPNPAVKLEVSLPDQTLQPGQGVLFDLADFFHDPDGDATYVVNVSGDAATASASMADGVLRVSSRAGIAGVATIEVIASDDHGSVSSTFTTTVFPTVFVPVEVRYLDNGQVEVDVTLGALFSDDLVLPYGLRASGTAADVLKGDLVFVAGETVQTLVIDLEATGLGEPEISQLVLSVEGEWFSEQFSIAVNNPDDPPPAAPVIAPIANQTLYGGDVLVVSLPISDTDTPVAGLAVSALSSSSVVVATVDLSLELVDGVWQLTVPVADVAVGFTRITVTVTDGHTMVSTSFGIEMNGTGSAVTLVSSLPDQTLQPGQGVLFDLADFFRDPDGNATYVVNVSGDFAMASASVANGVLSVLSRADLAGAATIEVIASDDRGSVSSTFTLTVFPTVSTSAEVRYLENDRVEIDVTLGASFSDAVTLPYALRAAGAGTDALTGELVFAAGETVQTLVVDLESTGLGEPEISQLLLSIAGEWFVNQFSIAIDNPDDPPPAAPNIALIADQTPFGGDVLIVSLPISDTDTLIADLAVTALSSNGVVVPTANLSLELVDGVWQLTIPVAELTAGFTRITVSVTDGDTTVSASFGVEIAGPNPMVRLVAPVEGPTLISGQSTAIDLADHFSDPDGNASYQLVAVGENRVVDSAIIDGRLRLTARTDLSGAAIFDLVATDERGTAATRFSVVTYPTIAVAERARQDNAGEAVIDVTLSNPSTQPLTMSYSVAAAGADADATSGSVTFAAGETSQEIRIDLSAARLDTADISMLDFGVAGAWINGSFEVGVTNRNPVEVFDLWLRPTIQVGFSLSYSFVGDGSEESDEDEDSSGDDLPSGAAQPLVVANAAIGPDGNLNGRHGVARSGGGSPDLARATSLESLQMPRRMSGI